MTEQPRDLNTGQFISGLSLADQHRAETTRKVGEALEKYAAELEATKKAQSERVTTPQQEEQQEREARGEFLRSLLIGDEEEEQQ